MKKINQVCSFILALTLLLGMIPMASAAALPFADVGSGTWYEPHVRYCYENGLMTGVSADAFAPNDKMSRGMLVTVLYRIDGAQEIRKSIPFSDVSETAWYYDAVAWAYQNGVVNGTSATTFSPDAHITREAMVTIFYRYALAKGYDVSNSANLSGYADSRNISSWAANAFSWAVAEGIVEGVGSNKLGVTGTATRAECATIIERYVEWTNGSFETDPSEPTEPSAEVTEPTEPATEPSTEPATEPTTAPTEPTTQPTVPDTDSATDGIDIEALEEYGRSYASDTYGYNGTTSCNPDNGAGYYSPSLRLICSMEEGYKFVQSKIDDQYSCDVAAGRQITIEYEGQLLRATLNVDIVAAGEPDAYWIYVYYGGSTG